MGFTRQYLIALGFVVADAAILCPKNHCLMRTKSGNTAASFSCEQFKDEGHICGPEYGSCKCDGKVKLGNYIQFGKAAAWSAEKAITGKTQCTRADVAGGKDIVSGAKVCYCTPTKLASTTRSSQASSCAGKDWEAPKCVIATIQQSAAGMDAKKMWDSGYNLVGSWIVTSNSLNGLLSTTGSKVLEYNKDTHVTKFQIPCTDGAQCMKKLDDARANQKKVDGSLEKAWQTYVDQAKAAKADLGALANFRDLIRFEHLPAKLDDVTKYTNSQCCALTGKTTCTTTTSQDKVSASSPMTASLAAISAFMVLMLQ